MNPSPPPTPATDPKDGANPTEDSQDSSTSAQTAAIQVYDGDGVSEFERETLSRLASEKAAEQEKWAALPKARKLNAKWTIDVQEDFKSVQDVNLGDILAKDVIDDMLNEAFIPSSLKREDVRAALEKMSAPKSLLTATT